VIAPSLHTKVYLAKDPTDMRKGFPGLIVLTEAVLRLRVSKVWGWWRAQSCTLTLR
jgi:transposase